MDTGIKILFSKGHKGIFYLRDIIICVVYHYKRFNYNSIFGDIKTLSIVLVLGHLYHIQQWCYNKHGK